MNLKEEFYDSEIAPALLELAKKCQDKQINFMAFVEWDRGIHAGGGSSETIALPTPRSAAAHTVYAAIKCKGNMDAFLPWLVKYAEEHGSNSIVLNMLIKAIGK